MKKKLLMTAAMLTTALITAGCGGGSDADDGASGGGGTGGPVVMGKNGAVDVNTAGPFAIQMLAEVNAARATARNCGGQAMPAVAPLSWNALLAQTAQSHAQDMSNRNYFAHNSPEGLMADDRARVAGYQYSTLGENIGSGTSSIKEIMTAWLKSPGHCRTLMEPAFRELGAGYVNFRFVLVFGAP